MSSPKQVPTKFNPTLGEGVYEYFITNYLIHWFQAKTVKPDVYNRAMKELTLLNKRKAKQANKDNISTVSKQNIDSEREEVKKLGERPSSAIVTRRNPSKQEQASGSRNIQLENGRLKSEIHALEEQLSEVYLELQDKSSRLNRMKEDLKNSVQEVNDLKIRLSKLAGDKLRDNNPDLADLSDTNRPTELGKRFSEIYDNEWSDAFENIEKKDETEKVRILHEVAVSAFKYCHGIFRGQVEEIRGILLQETLNPGSDESRKTTKTVNIHNNLKEMRKQFAPITAVNVAQNFVPDRLEDLLQGTQIPPEEITDSLRKYAMKCAEICWYMVVCDPPMALSEDIKGMKFNTDIYKPYTRSIRDVKTPVVELHVWPALHLHDGGPLVAKGVAQPNAK
ncbi:uncharacterized protein LOC128559466 [Mercenaria mercenaria]|uniref:uncharacterized protein LOC128559466 n=1 Tax=Mercenaria mercenaria TaxID=6596 RepID=UPI00234EA686|nr:uncharacterized protein LOC128559466 [Mercenaria mercenaria]